MQFFTFKQLSSENKKESIVLPVCLQQVMSQGPQTRFQSADNVLLQIVDFWRVY